MKIKYLSSILIFFTIVITSCQEEYKDYLVTESSHNPNPITRSVNQDLTDCEWGLLSTGDSVRLPWSNLSQGTIPLEVRQDVHYDDGWRILYSNINILGLSHEYDNLQNGANYILLYNKYTGVLKGFYYAIQMPQNNTALWQLSITNMETTLFNFATSYAKPMNESCGQTICISNISTNGVTQGFDLGWNCFLQELAYDENSLDETLDILGFSMNEATFQFNGVYNLTSEGTIINSTSGISPLPTSIIEGVASLFGNRLQNWIAGNFSSGNGVFKIKLNSNELQQLVTNPIKTLVNANINKVFTSLFGQTSTTTKTIQLTTHGSVTIDGNGHLPTSGLVWPLQGIPLDGIGEKLGVWNLAEAPKYQITDAPLLIEALDRPYEGGVMYYYNVTGIPSLTVVANPNSDVQLGTSYSLVRYLPNTSNTNFWNTSKLYFAELTNTDSPSHKLLYLRGTEKIYNFPFSYKIMTHSGMPNCKKGTNSPAYDYTIGDTEIRQSLLFKVVIRGYLYGNVKSYSCKTFVPLNEVLYDGGTRPYQWTYQELVDAGYAN